MRSGFIMTGERQHVAKGEIHQVYGERPYSVKDAESLAAVAQLALMIKPPKNYEVHLINPKRVPGLLLYSMSLGIARKGAIKGEVTAYWQVYECVRLAPRLNSDGQMVDFSTILRPVQALPKPVERSIKDLHRSLREFRKLSP